MESPGCAAGTAAGDGTIAPGRAGGSNKTNASTCSLRIPLLSECLEQYSRRIWPRKLLFRYCLFGHESSLPSPELPRRQSAIGPNERTNVVLTGTAQLGPARLTDCPASESDSAGHSAAAFKRAGQPGRPPVHVDTYRLRLTPIDGVEGPSPTRPGALADPTWARAPRSRLRPSTVSTPAASRSGSAAAPSASTVPHSARVSGRAIRVSAPGRPAAGFAAEGGARS